MVMRMESVDNGDTWTYMSRIKRHSLSADEHDAPLPGTPPQLYSSLMQKILMSCLLAYRQQNLLQNYIAFRTHFERTLKKKTFNGLT